MRMNSREDAEALGLLVTILCGKSEGRISTSNYGGKIILKIPDITYKWGETSGGGDH